VYVNGNDGNLRRKGLSRWSEKINCLLGAPRCSVAYARLPTAFPASWVPRLAAFLC
jgi:hypothetical protein